MEGGGEEAAFCPVLLHASFARTRMDGFWGKIREEVPDHILQASH